MNKGFIETGLAAVLAAIALVLMVATVVVEAMAVKATAAAESPWYVHTAQADAALEAGQLTAAMQHSQEAYAAAVASRRSEGMVEVGNLYRRLAARGRLGEAAVDRARHCYLTALLRARGEGSIDGIVRATEAFLELRDDAMVAQGLKFAREVASRDADPRAHERVAMLAARVARAGAAGR
jgi:hypothetical protein